MDRSVYVTGSLRKHHEGIIGKIAEFERAGFTVTSPRNIVVEATSNELSMMLRSDPKKFLGMSVKENFCSIMISSVFYIFNPSGYCDTEGSLYIGCALANRKHIFSLEDMEDLTLRQYVTIATVDQILGMVEGNTLKSKSVPSESHVHLFD